MGASVRFIVPPQLFERVARTGAAEDREVALDTLAIDHSIRTARVQNAALRARTPKRLVAAPGGRGNPDRTIFNARHRADVHATTVMRTEGQPPIADSSANQAYDGLGDTYRFFWEVLGRDSIDDAALPLLGEVHFGVHYDNAFWDGERMMFGDGDGRLFTGFTGAVEVIGHELTHGVTQDTLNLLYTGQSGALNESISDVFGSLVRQYKLDQTAEQADWLIGAGILGPALHGVALRSMKAPGTAYEGDNQPATMSGYLVTSADNGGVHTNSGIPNHAFYLVASALGGHSWEKAGRIWYETMRDSRLTSSAQFQAFANLTADNAGRLFGYAEQQAVIDAWQQVGITVPGTLPPPSAAMW